MHLSPTTQAAMLLVGLAVLNAFAIQWSGYRAPAAAAARTTSPAALLGPSGQMAARQCREHVAIIFDVHWAAACMNNPLDDSPECTLPDERAAPLNLARARAEERCAHEASAADRVAGKPAAPHQ